MARAHPEEDLQRAVVRLLDVGLPKEALCWATPNQRGSRKRWEMGLLRAMGVRAGIPDLFVLHDGHLIGLELKAPRGRVSDTQTSLHATLRAAGATVCVCRSPEEVIAALATAGVPLRARLF